MPRFRLRAARSPCRGVGDRPRVVDDDKRHVTLAWHAEGRSCTRSPAVPATALPSCTTKRRPSSTARRKPHSRSILSASPRRPPSAHRLERDRGLEVPVLTVRGKPLVPVKPLAPVNLPQNSPTVAAPSAGSPASRHADSYTCGEIRAETHRVGSFITPALILASSFHFIAPPDSLALQGRNSAIFTISAGSSELFMRRVSQPKSRHVPTSNPLLTPGGNNH